MNRAAKRTVRQGAFLLGDSVGCSNLSFFTGTLPGDTDEQCEIALAEWSNICRQFIQSIGRELDRAGLPRWVIGCTEIQPKRYERTGQPWPHLHLLFPTRGRGRWLIHRGRVNALWRRACLNRLGGTDADYRLAPRTDPIDDDAEKLGKYLSKYMGKGNDASIMQARSEGWQLPRNWHHCTHELGHAISQATSTLTAKTAAWLFHCCRKRIAGCNVWAAICPEPSAESPATWEVGFVGALAAEFQYRVLLFNWESKTA
jgi:hypothetical protein